MFRLHPPAPMDPVVRRHPENRLRLPAPRVPSDLLPQWDLEALWRRQVQVHRQIPVARQVPRYPEHHLHLMVLRARLNLWDLGARWDQQAQVHPQLPVGQGVQNVHLLLR